MEITTHNNIFIRIHKCKKPLADIWLLHGYGESSLCYREAFDSILCDNFNLFAPDAPGFGVSPYIDGRGQVGNTINIFEKLIVDISGNNAIALCGHSLGGLVGTGLCKNMPENIFAYANIEGNLTSADCFATGLATDFENAEEFQKFLLGKMYKSADGSDLAMQRYFASLRFAHPDALLLWGKSCVDETGDTKGGEYFISINQPSLYIWGDKSAPEKTKAFIRKNSIENISMTGCGHWPMIDKPNECYAKINDFFLKSAP